MLVEYGQARKSSKPRRAQLSFELSEVLHMLEALEGMPAARKPDDTPQTA
jgi:hypothetical protein